MTYTSSKSILLYHLHIGIWTLVQLNIMWFSSNSVKLMNSMQMSPVSGVWCGMQCLVSWPDYYRHVPLLTITILEPRHYIATQFTVDTTNTILYNIKIIQFVVYNTFFMLIFTMVDGK